jgi:preprotein translocase subunit SecG
MNVIVIRPSSFPLARSYPLIYYFVVAGSVGIIYNWGLTFGKEIELIWRQRWSLMTFLYLSVRYAGIGFAVIIILLSVPTISMTDAGCLNMYNAYDWISVVIEPLLGVIMIARLHAMYQRSRKVLIFLVVIFLAITITNAVIAAIRVTQMTGEEFVFSGTYQCIIDFAEDSPFLNSMTWILGTVWEVLALCLAVWISVKHFRELRQHSTSGIIGDCFTVLMKTHLSYFASFLAISCFQMGLFSPTLANPYSLETQTYDGLSQIFKSVQMFVLGPRLILGVREYHAKLVANSDTASAMTSIAFEERVHVSTSSSV